MNGIFPREDFKLGYIRTPLCVMHGRLADLTEWIERYSNDEMDNDEDEFVEAKYNIPYDEDDKENSDSDDETTNE